MFKKQYHDPQWLTDLVNEYIKPTSLNLCCGQSKIGDIKVDIDKTTNLDIIADMWYLPFKRGVFDSIYCDPVWEDIAIKKRYKLMWLIRDMLKANGILIWNCNWGFQNLKGLKLIYTHYNHAKWRGSVTVTMVYKKINAQIEEYL